MPDKHAFLSPSSSVRWYFCPPSARLCEQLPDQGNVFASEGTEAHALCEFLLKDALGMECADPRPTLQYYTEEMEEAARGYVRYILEKTAAYRAAAAGTDSGTPMVFVEQRLDLREYIPESMGTADCVILAGDTAEVIDFKYGMHRVPATSMQLRIYALGACEVFSFLYDFSRVRMTVYQPRLSSVDETEIGVAETTWHPLPGMDATTSAASVSGLVVVVRRTALPFLSSADPSEAIAALPAFANRPCSAIAMLPDARRATLPDVGPSSHAPDLSEASSADSPLRPQNLPSFRTTPAAIPL